MDDYDDDNDDNDDDDNNNDDDLINAIYKIDIEHDHLFIGMFLPSLCVISFAN